MTISFQGPQALMIFDPSVSFRYRMDAAASFQQRHKSKRPERYAQRTEQINVQLRMMRKHEGRDVLPYQLWLFEEDQGLRWRSKLS